MSFPGPGDLYKSVKESQIWRSFFRQPYPNTSRTRALAVMKEAVGLGLEHPDAEAVRRTLALSQDVFQTADGREGARAFLEKRAPHFRHS